jgi:DNA-binding transcriptional MocR family regulator
VVVEDNALADLALTCNPPRPIAAFSNSCAILTLGSMSKLFWGGLRVGWVRAAPQVIAQLTRMKVTQDLGSSVASQALSVRLLANVDNVKAFRRKQATLRLEVLTRLLSELLPSWTWRRPAGGLSLWIRLPYGRADHFAQVAARHGVVIIPGSTASTSSNHDDCIRLPFVRDPEVLTDGVQRLAEAWEAYSRTLPAAPGAPPRLTGDKRGDRLLSGRSAGKERASLTRCRVVCARRDPGEPRGFDGT